MSFDTEIKRLMGDFLDAAPNSQEAYDAADTMATYAARYVENAEEPAAFKHMEALLGQKL